MGAKGNRPPFTMVYATWPKLLHEAGVSGVEWAVFVALAQHPRNDGLLSRPIADYYEGERCGICTATGISRCQVTRALANLQKKTFTNKNGNKMPILTKVEGGYTGKVAVYRCNMPYREEFIPRKYVGSDE